MGRNRGSMVLETTYGGFNLVGALGLDTRQEATYVGL